MRRSPRFPFSAAAELVSPTEILSFRVAEISLYGCYLEPITPLNLPNGTQVTIKIFSDGEVLETPATVLYSAPSSGVGVAFRGVGQPYRSILRKWLAEAVEKNHTVTSIFSGPANQV